MALGYEFCCECGAKRRIEVSQAGQDLVCECGKTNKIPSMLKIKKLPIWSDDVLSEDGATSATDRSSEESRPVQSTPDASLSSNSSPSTRKQPVLSGNRLGIFIVGLIMLAFSSYYLNVVVRRTPLPIDVFGKQTSFKAGDTQVFRNSSPVSQEDYNFFLYYAQAQNLSFIINDEIIDAMSPYDAYLYLGSLENGLDLSENFYENFDEIKNLYRIRVCFFAILVVISFCVCLLPWLIPRKKTVVGTIRGSEWKA